MRDWPSFSVRPRAAYQVLPCCCASVDWMSSGVHKWVELSLMLLRPPVYASCFMGYRHQGVAMMAKGKKGKDKDAGGGKKAKQAPGLFRGTFTCHTQQL